MSLSPKLFARFALGAATIVEGIAALTRHRERELAFDAAIERAKATGRRLVVIGDPDAKRPHPGSTAPTAAATYV
ncbi:MAG: hypothetical protein IPK80_29050 [Nannocystis sp.]|nr:hypothetical protein [Nannocystis sp.]